MSILKKKAKCQCQKVKYQQNGFITRNTHVKYSKVISKVIVIKKRVKLQGQGHSVKNNGTHGKV